jgi:hypothetical protein
VILKSTEAFPLKPIDVLRPLLLFTVLTTACTPKQVDLDDEATRRQIGLLMPSRINIVGPFTRFRSFDDDEVPDGVELLLQPVNSFGDPVNIAGTVIAELYEFRQASGDPKGTKLEQWDIPLTSEKDQRTHWNRTTTMYEFQLQLNPAAIPPNHKYVLAVTYNTPLDEHMTDEYVMEVPLSARSAVGAG